MSYGKRICISLFKAITKQFLSENPDKICLGFINTHQEVKRLLGVVSSSVIYLLINKNDKTIILSQ